MNSLFLIGLIIGLMSTALTIFSIFFNYDEEKAVKLSKWGWIAVLVTVVLAIGSTSIKYSEHLESNKSKSKADSLQNIMITLSDSTFKLQQQIIEHQRTTRNQILKTNYPLEPITLFFDLEYSMDLPELEGFAKRAQLEIYNYLIEAREGRGETHEDLSSEEVLFILTNNDEWLPDKQNEEKAHEALILDHTRFDFSSTINGGESILSYSSVSEHYRDVIQTLPSPGPTEQEVILMADFSRRVFIKKVTCLNPLKTGNDVVSVSSVDLIGKRVNWKPFFTPASEWKLTKFAIGFKYDSQESNRSDKRWRLIEDNSEDVIITNKDIGLESIIK